MSGQHRDRFARFEYQFERLLWRLRLVVVVPVLMSLISALAMFVLGTKEVSMSLLLLRTSSSSHQDSGHMLSYVIGGVDLYLIGIALLIFGYGVYELIISPIDPARQHDDRGIGLLDIRNLDQLKEKLVKVLVVALIVSAFKAMLELPIKDPLSLAAFCLSVLLLALSAWLMAGGPQGQQRQHH